MYKKTLTVLLTALILTGIAAAQIGEVDETELDETDLEEQDIEQAEEAEQEVQDAFIEESTLDFENVTEEVPRPVTMIMPSQRINIEMTGLEEQFSMTMEPRQGEMALNQTHVDNPTLEVWINEEAIKNQEIDVENIGEHIKEENIEYEPHSWFNRIMVFIAETILL